MLLRSTVLAMLVLSKSANLVLGADAALFVGAYDRVSH